MEKATAEIYLPLGEVLRLLMCLNYDYDDWCDWYD